jgi:phage gp29-like protein
MTQDANIERRALRLVVNAWQTTFRPSWSVGQVVSALREHRLGWLSSSSQLLDTMGEDDEIPGDIKKRVNSVVRAAFSFEGEDEEANEFISEHWSYIIDKGELFDFVRNFVLMGVGVGVLDWQLKESVWIPCFRNLPTEFLHYDETIKRWKYQAQEGEFTVEPGNGTWVLLTSGQRGWLYGLVRALGLLWVAKQFVFRDWNRYNERHGLPIIKAKVPVSVIESEKKKFVQEIQDLNAEGVIALPQGVDGPDVNYDVDLLETKDQSWQSFQFALERFDRKIQVMLLGGNLGTEVATTGANRAAAETHKDNLDSEVAMPDSEALGQCFQRQVVRAFFFFNRGPEASYSNELPYPCWDTEPPEDIQGRATAQKTFGEAITAIQNAGFKVKNIEAIAEQYGFELQEAPENKPQPAAARPGAPGAKPRQLRLASGDEDDAAIEGQRYLDALGDGLNNELDAVMKPDTKTLLRIVRLSTSYEDMRTKVHMVFEQLDPNKLSDIVEKAAVLAALNGRFSVLEDV